LVRSPGEALAPPNKQSFGILARSGKVFARLVDNTEAKDLIPIIRKKVKSGLENLL